MGLQPEHGWPDERSTFRAPDLIDEFPFFPTIFAGVFHVEQLTLLYLQYCSISANIIRKRRSENKVDFQATRKVAESGIFRGMMFTIRLWLPSSIFFLFYENAGVTRIGDSPI